MRAYRDEEALLLLLRFEPEAAEDCGTGDADPLVAVAMHAMPGMIASAVEARTGVRLDPGNLSLCSARGLAVFAFTVLDDDIEEPLEDDLFRFDAGFDRARPALRLAS